MSQNKKLCAICLGLSLGIIWSVSLLLIGILSISDHGVAFVHSIGKFYIGYSPTWLGSLIGAAWGFLDAFIGGLVLAWLYNYFVKHCKICSID